MYRSGRQLCTWRNPSTGANHGKYIDTSLQTVRRTSRAFIKVQRDRDKDRDRDRDRDKDRDMRWKIETKIEKEK